MSELATTIIPYLAAIIGFFAVYVLNGIRSEVRDVKTSLQALEKDLRGGVSNLDRRVTTLEVKCEMQHDNCNSCQV